MKIGTKLAAVVLVVFAAFTAYPVWKYGYFGFVAVHMQNAWGIQVIVDLVIALSLFLFWMVPDARRRGLPAWPFVIATFALGSIGALGYLVARGVLAPARDGDAGGRDVREGEIG